MLSTERPQSERPYQKRQPTKALRTPGLAQHTDRPLRRHDGQAPRAGAPRDRRGAERPPERLAPALRGPVVALHADAGGPRGGQEAAGVVPAQAVDGRAEVERLDDGGLAQVPDGDGGGRGAARGRREPDAVLGEGERGDGARARARGEGGGLRARLGVEQLDLAVGAAGGEEVAVRVEGAAREF